MQPDFSQLELEKYKVALILYFQALYLLVIGTYQDLFFVLRFEKSKKSTYDKSWEIKMIKSVKISKDFEKGKNS